VRLLFDEQLAEELCQLLGDRLTKKKNIRLLGKGGASDEEIWQLALEHRCVLVTKDEDFHRLSILRGAPPKVVWIRLGNCTTAEIASLLLEYRADIQRFIDQDETTFLDMLQQPSVQPDWTIKVSDVVNQSDLPILYVYDFGDDWRHMVMYEGGAQLDRSIKYPRCVSGARKCPPEDCGGVHGFIELLEAIRDPKHERHRELLEWLGGGFDPADFDARKVRFDDPKTRWRSCVNG